MQLSICPTWDIEQLIRRITYSCQGVTCRLSDKCPLEKPSTVPSTVALKDPVLSKRIERPPMSDEATLQPSNSSNQSSEVGATAPTL